MGRPELRRVPKGSEGQGEKQKDPRFVIEEASTTDQAIGREKSEMI